MEADGEIGGGEPWAASWVWAAESCLRAGWSRAKLVGLPRLNLCPSHQRDNTTYLCSRFTAASDSSSISVCSDDLSSRICGSKAHVARGGRSGGETSGQARW
jgi:hypothetical protein